MQFRKSERDESKGYQEVKSERKLVLIMKLRFHIRVVTPRISKYYENAKK